jgi:hypothetical protein
MAGQQASGRVRVGFAKAIGMLAPYVWGKVLEQVKSVWLIVLYLIVFQVLILGIPVAGAATVAIGIALVVLGLALFMEGLFLGLMPIGESCGVRLPQKVKLPVLIGFAFILGVGATFAEPAIGILQSAGSTVKAWNAPLLFLLLTKHVFALKCAVGVGVGIAAIFGVLRILYNWSLKPFLYVLVVLLSGISIWAWFDPNLVYVSGVAWDCGGVTTGPVTVPLVLALGIGISRVAAKSTGRDEAGAAGGFGVVTLASIFPVLTVFALGAALAVAAPPPMPDADFFAAANRGRVAGLFESREAMTGYAMRFASDEGRLACFDGDRSALMAWVAETNASPSRQEMAFGSGEAWDSWILREAPADLRLAAFGNPESLAEAEEDYSARPASPVNGLDVIVRNSFSAVQAILPLCLFLLAVLLLVLRERLARRDEVFLGIALGLIGMSVFNMGIELGLSRVGGQVGEMLPSSYTRIELDRDRQVISGFDLSLVQSAVSADGGRERFFYVRNGTELKTLPFYPASYDEAASRYEYAPSRGPLFGTVGGIIVVVLFGFILGYGATLAEPALNALGQTVEELTVGTFKKSTLMHSVAVGVGTGIAVGMAKIVFDLPLVWLLVPPYAVLLFITKISSEDFVNIGWDSAGVTTGPITVPLVLAMGLGVGGQLGAVEGFGILALASVYPILSVLLVGLAVARKRRAALAETPSAAGA